MTEHNLKTEASLEIRASARAQVTRGEKSWAILNTFAGFALAIEGTLISMVDVLPWWMRCISYLVIGGTTLGLIRSNWRVQDRIIGWVTRYQDKPRG